MDGWESGVKERGGSRAGWMGEWGEEERRGWGLKAPPPPPPPPPPSLPQPPPLPTNITTTSLFCLIIKINCHVIFIMTDCPFNDLFFLF